MTARARLLFAASLALALGCPRPRAEPEKGAPPKPSFLQEVIKARLQLASDSESRIPALIRREDAVMMTNELERIARYRVTVGKLDASNVEPKVARVRQGLLALLDVYRFTCIDTAELFREIAAFDAGRPGRPPLAPALLSAMRASKGDTVAALDSLLSALGGRDTRAAEGGVNLGPIIGSVRSDAAALRKALADQKEIESHVAFPSGG